MNKIPIFLHIPKSGGTYVWTWAVSILRLWCRKNNINDAMNISVESNNKTVFTVFCRIPNFKDNENFYVNPVNNYYFNIDIDLFLSELSNKKIDIFFITVKSEGFSLLRKKIIESICDIVNMKPIYYMTMRDSFSTCQSLYNYLNSEKSNHELTHGSIKFSNFSDYLKSTKLSDSWLIRVLMNISDNESITEDHFNSACETLDNVQIFNIKDVELLIDEMLAEYCYIKRKDMPASQIRVRKNEMNAPKIAFSELDDETKKAFMKRTRFDRRLYKKYRK
jgi:hypothetical protein